MLRTPILLLISLAAACDGGGDGSLLGGDPVGQWRELPNATDDDPPEPVAERQVLEFTADGIWNEVGDPDERGTWEVDGGNLILTEEGFTGSFTVPFRARGDRFVISALIPDGAVDSFIGDWTGSVIGEDGPLTFTLTLNADMTATTFTDRGIEQETRNGTWRNVGDDIVVTTMPQPNLTLNMRLSLVGGVLGSPYERL